VFENRINFLEHIIVTIDCHFFFFTKDGLKLCNENTRYKHERNVRENFYLPHQRVFQKLRVRVCVCVCFLKINFNNCRVTL
jgi:hypothetical protein